MSISLRPGLVTTQTNHNRDICIVGRDMHTCATSLQRRTCVRMAPALGRAHRPLWPYYSHHLLRCLHRKVGVRPVVQRGTREYDCCGWLPPDLWQCNFPKAQSQDISERLTRSAAVCVIHLYKVSHLRVDCLYPCGIGLLIRSQGAPCSCRKRRPRHARPVVRKPTPPYSALDWKQQAAWVTQALPSVDDSAVPRRRFAHTAARYALPNVQLTTTSQWRDVRLAYGFPCARTRASLGLGRYEAFKLLVPRGYCKDQVSLATEVYLCCVFGIRKRTRLAVVSVVAFALGVLLLTRSGYSSVQRPVQMLGLPQHRQDAITCYTGLPQ